MNLNSVVFSKISVFTSAFAEQHRISDCLSALDDQITVQTQRINALQKQKKGLMQQLFPTSEGVEA